MTLEQALKEDVFYDVAGDAYATYIEQGGTVLDIDEYLRFHKKDFKPWHIAKKEKELKEKFKKSKEVIKQKLYDYFLKVHNEA